MHLIVSPGAPSIKHLSWGQFTVHKGKEGDWPTEEHLWIKFNAKWIFCSSSWTLLILGAYSVKTLKYVDQTIMYEDKIYLDQTLILGEQTIIPVYKNRVILAQPLPQQQNVYTNIVHTFIHHLRIQHQIILCHHQRWCLWHLFLVLVTHSILYHPTILNYHQCKIFPLLNLSNPLLFENKPSPLFNIPVSL